MQNVLPLEESTCLMVNIRLFIVSLAQKYNKMQQALEAKGFAEYIS